MISDRTIYLWENYGPGLFLEKPDQLALKVDPNNAMTMEGTNRNILASAITSIIFLFLFGILLYNNVEKNFIKHGLGWFTVIPIFPIIFIIHRQWKDIKHFKIFSFLVPLLWGSWLGSLFGVFEHQFPLIGLQSLTALASIIFTSYLAFRFLGFRDNFSLRVFSVLSLILINMMGFDAILSLVFLKYDSLMIISGGPSLLLITYMVILGAITIPMELSILERSIEDKYQVEAQWYFSYKIISICFTLLLWVFLLILYARGKK